jgi:hypothetical protein
MCIKNASLEICSVLSTCLISGASVWIQALASAICGLEVTKSAGGKPTRELPHLRLLHRILKRNVLLKWPI